MIQVSLSYSLSLILNEINSSWRKELLVREWFEKNLLLSPNHMMHIENVSLSYGSDLILDEITPPRERNFLYASGSEKTYYYRLTA